ncbi:endospore germination permease [Tumebacillus sp. ITR2]|uniref:Endospore germination permease n=1 Tax=Tumebacillus amylolyticus TaxID=2801339 RepID=A0ABS1J7N7_9BACL|nr:endospore germination permease [Tumebacillus amylolyticus]MBL0386220.1 endospore germination permease [Tumebacillus amylolyticus]
MEYPRQITAIQAAAILISSIIGVGLLPLPRFAVDAANTGAPLITLLGIGLASFGLWLITKLGMRFPNKSIVRYSEDILGKWIAALGSLAIILFFAILTSLAAREFGEVVVSSVLRRTPLEVTVVVMLILAAVNSRHDITTFTYIHHFYLPVLVAPALVIVGLSMKNSNVINLLPLLGNKPVLHTMTSGVFTIAALFQGFFIYTLVIPAMRRPERAMKASFWGMLISGGIYLLIVTATVSVFGAQEIKLLLWPTLELARTTSLPANILERLDAPFLIVWVIAVFTTLFSSYTLMIHSASELFRLRDHKMFSFFTLPFVFMMAMLPQNVLQMYAIIKIVGQCGLVLTIVYPLLLFLVAMIRKKRGDQQHEEQPLEQTG